MEGKENKKTTESSRRDFVRETRAKSKTEIEDEEE
jgi:hypothetical protein